MKFRISIPPSVNHLYRHGRGGRTYITAKGNTWFEEAGWEIKSQLGEYDTISKDCSVHIHLFTAIKRDVDNISKATLDLMAKHLGLMKDDELVVDLRVQKSRIPHIKDERLEIEFKEVEDE